MDASTTQTSGVDQCVAASGTTDMSGANVGASTESAKSAQLLLDTLTDALAHAAAAGQLELVRYLCEAEAPTRAGLTANSQNDRALSHAIYHKREEVTLYLIQRGDTDICVNHGEVQHLAWLACVGCELVRRSVAFVCLSTI